MKRYLNIEGNIGSGKTTMVKAYSEKFDIASIEEPVKEWEDLGIFGEYHKDPHKYGLSFQMYVILTRMIKIFRSSVIHKKLIIDRSGLTDRYVFMNAMVDAGYLNPMEIAMYDSIYYNIMEMAGIFPKEDSDKVLRLYSPDEIVLKLETASKLYSFDTFDKTVNIDELIEQTIANLDLYGIIKGRTTYKDEITLERDKVGFVYLHTTPSVCDERIKKRKRSAESGIPLEYLEKIDLYHRTKLLPHIYDLGYPILIISADIDYETSGPDPAFDKVLDRIHDFYRAL